MLTACRGGSRAASSDEQAATEDTSVVMAERERANVRVFSCRRRGPRLVLSQWLAMDAPDGAKPLKLGTHPRAHLMLKAPTSSGGSR